MSLLIKQYVGVLKIKFVFLYFRKVGEPLHTLKKTKGKRKVQGVSQSQTAALPRHQEEEETHKTKQPPIGQTYEKHKD